MYRRFDYTIEEDAAGMTAASYLRSRGWSHRTLAYVKRLEGGILLKGESIPASALLRAGDLLSVCLLEESSSSGVSPCELPLDILYEDEDLLIANKPAGIPVPPSAGHREQCMAGAVLHYYEEQGIPFTVRCISRLDADTSGAMLVGKNMHAASLLSEMLKRREITRIYLGIAEGEILRPCTVSVPIARLEGSAIARCADPARGEEAVTQLTPLCYSADLGLTLVRFKLLTGRTHQIRVHMQYLGHPLTGDFLYPSRHDLIGRQALHAASLSFVHPLTGKEISVTAPLPEDMKALIPDLPLS